MKNIDLGDREVKIRRIKLKEMKDIIKNMATKVTEVANFFYNKKMTDEELLENIPSFIIKNMEFFEGYLIQFSDLDQEGLDDLEILSVIRLIKGLIIYNGISEDFLKSFFYNFKKAREVVEEQNLVTEVPRT